MSELSPPPPKPRSWFQLHLSTCVVLMVVAGALAYLSISPGSNGQSFTWYGWPAMAYEQHLEVFLYGMSDPVEIPTLHRKWLISGLIIDVGFALVVLGLVARVLENRVRRRQRARAAQGPAP